MCIRDSRAIELGGYKEAQEFTGINGGHEVTTGFGHGTVLGIADKVIDAVKAGAIKHFFLVGGCDGAKVGRNYYTEMCIRDRYATNYKSDEDGSFCSSS